MRALPYLLRPVARLRRERQRPPALHILHKVHAALPRAAVGPVRPCLRLCEHFPVRAQQHRRHHQAINRVLLIRHFKTCTTDIYLQNECAHVGPTWSLSASRCARFSAVCTTIVSICAISDAEPECCVRARASFCRENQTRESTQPGIASDFRT